MASTTAAQTTHRHRQERQDEAHLADHSGHSRLCWAPEGRVLTYYFLQKPAPGAVAKAAPAVPPVFFPAGVDDRQSPVRRHHALLAYRLDAEAAGPEGTSQRWLNACRKCAATF